MERVREHPSVRCLQWVTNVGSTSWQKALLNPLPTQVAKRPQLGSEPFAKVALGLSCAERRGHMGRHNQAPKQVLGVVTLHAICQERHVVVLGPDSQVV
jgi:hypothetical protein